MFSDMVIEWVSFLSLFYCWRAARSPIAAGLLWDFGLWPDCELISV